MAKEDISKKNAHPFLHLSRRHSTTPDDMEEISVSFTLVNRVQRSVLALHQRPLLFAAFGLQKSKGYYTGGVLDLPHPHEHDRDPMSRRD